MNIAGTTKIVVGGVGIVGGALSVIAEIKSYAASGLLAVTGAGLLVLGICAILGGK